MGTLWQDLRYGARMLLKKPGFTLVAVITLSLGIGANSAIFSLVNTALLRPLPVDRPEQIVTFNKVIEKTGRSFPTFSYPDYRDLRDRNDVFAGLSAYRFIVASLSHDGTNERVWGYLVTGNYFDQLGIKPALGRMMTAEDDKVPGAHPVAVITYRYWQKRFGADPKAIGQSVIVNGHNYTIIGVTPPGFIGTEIAYAAEI